MPPTSRPKSIWLLIIVFAWSAFKGIEILVRGNSTADRILFDHAGLGWLFVPLIVTTVVLDFVTLWFLIRPAMVGQTTGLLSVGMSALETIVAFLIAGANPDVARHAYVVSRESRGLSVRQEALDLITNPGVNLLLLLVSLGLSVLWVVLLVRNRPYFARAGREAG